MKKRVFQLSLALLIIYGISVAYISSDAKDTLSSYINSINRFNPYIKSEVSSFKPQIVGAKATITTTITDSLLKKQIKNILKLPIDTNIDITYGPIVYLPNRISFAKLGIENNILISSLIKKEALAEYKSVFPNDIEVKSSSIISFDKRADDKIDIDIKRVIDHQKSLEYRLTPIRVSRDYNINTLLGTNKLHIDRVSIKDLETNKVLLDANSIDAKFRLDTIAKSGLIYGAYTLKGDTTFYIDNLSSINSIKVSSYSSVNLTKVDNNYSNLKIENSLKALDKITSHIAFDINSTKTVINIQNLGSRGLVELIELQKLKIQNQKAMLIASSSGDMEALAKALANISTIENRLIPTINHLLIKGKTKIALKEYITTNRSSYIDLNATYMGEPLRGDIMNALVMLAANADRLFNAHLNLKLEKSLTKRLYPQASWILDAMSKKSLAKIENGYYILKADLIDGKIIINNTKYAPQELIMLILM